MSDLLSPSTVKPTKGGTAPKEQVKKDLAAIEEVPEPVDEKKKDVMTAMGVEFLKAMQKNDGKGANAKGKKKK